MVKEYFLKLINKPNTEREHIVIKGYKSGLVLIIPETGAFKEYLVELEEHLAKSNDFFKGARVQLKLGKRKTTTEEWDSLLALLEGAGLQYTPNIETNQANQSTKTVNKRFYTPPKDDFVKLDTELDIKTAMLKKTIRSGQRIEFDGNLLIMGDVNPGAEVVANGDIIVLGKVRGTIHAGASGNTEAKIVAFLLEPLQIRIANIISRAPEKGKTRRSTSEGPEVAKIKNNLIIVEKYL